MHALFYGRGTRGGAPKCFVRVAGAVAVCLFASACAPGVSGTAPTAASVNAAVVTDLSQVVAGAKVLCTDESTGEQVAAVVDDSIVAHNAKALDRVSAACAAINAIPAN